MDRVDGVDRERKGAGALLVLAALVACSHVGPLSSENGAPDGGDTGADTAVLSPGFEDSLVSCDGCGDTFIYCWGPYGDGEVDLRFSVDGPALAMYESGESGIVTQYTIPEDDATVEILLGLDMSDDECTDIAPGDGIVWRAYAAASGTVTLWLTATSVDWSEWDVPAIAALQLEWVVFSPSDGGPGAPVTLPVFFREYISVGWFPG